MTIRKHFQRFHNPIHAASMINRLAIASDVRRRRARDERKRGGNRRGADQMRHISTFVLRECRPIFARWCDAWSTFGLGRQGTQAAGSIS